jgi:hypothetical protein
MNVIVDILAVVLVVGLAFATAHIIVLHEGLAGCRKKIKKLSETKSALIHQTINQQQEISDLREKLALAHSNYDSLERGMDEMQDSYEQQFHSFRDHLAAQQTALEGKNEIIDELKALAEKHVDRCLPWVEDHLS